MRKIVTIIFIAVIISCSSTYENQESQITQKNWHPSTSNAPYISMLYHFVKWNKIQEIQAGININRLKKITGNIAKYPGSNNIIVFMTISPDDIYYEVAIKLTKNESVEDISFKINIPKPDTQRILEKTAE